MKKSEILNLPWLSRECSSEEKQPRPIGTGFDSTAFLVGVDTVLTIKKAESVLIHRLEIDLSDQIKELIESEMKDFLPEGSGQFIWGSLSDERWLIKVAKLISGSELKNIPLAHKLSNPILIENLIRFLEKILEFYKRTGIALDTTGSRGKNGVETHLRMLNPLSSSNILANHLTSGLTLVDTDPYFSNSIQATSNFDREFMSKLIVLSWKISLLILNLVKQSHNFKTALIQENYEEKSKKPNNKETIAQVCREIDIITSLLDSAQIPYRITGSYAIAGMLQKKNVEYHPVDRYLGSGNFGDIDIVILSDDRAIIEKAKKIKDIINNSLAGKGLKLSLTVPNEDISHIFSKIFFPNPSFTGLTIEGTDIFAIYKKIRCKIAPIDSDASYFNYGSCQRPLITFSPEIQAALYAMRIGVIKPKNIPLVALLAELYGLNLSPTVSLFLQEVREHYPKDFSSAVWREVFDFWKK